MADDDLVIPIDSDLVSRLRQRAYAASSYYADLYAAADEIEQLRAAGDALSGLLDRCACNFDGIACRYCVARLEWKRVRRGS